MYTFSFLVLFLFVIDFEAKVWGAGLNEEFTFSRMTFQWPEEGNLAARFGSFRGSSGYYGSPQIIFEGNTNAERPPNQANNQNQNIPNSGNGSPSGSVDYQFENNIPMGAIVWQDKLFITIPRRRLGVPSTLNYISLKSNNRHNVPLKPYPNWNINLYPDTSGSNENFVSVYRIAIDPCDRMWLVDTGIVEVPGNRTTVKPHQLIIIDLQTDQVIHRFNLPNNVITPDTILSAVTVDVTKGNCGNAYAYFPDLAGYHLIVYSLRLNRAWRINHNYFFLEPQAGEFFVAGHNFQWSDGIFSIELSDIKQNGYRDAFFHSMAGTHMYRVSTRILRNETLATRSYHGDDFQVVGDRGPQSQTSTADIHKPSGVMFLALVNQNALGCWNTRNNLNTISVVQRDDERMIYPSDVKVYGDKVYGLTNTMPEFLYGRLNYDVTNFRIWSNDVRSAIRGTTCQARSSG